MFNLEEAITEWRRRILEAGINSPVVLEELESHLREDLERRKKSGVSAPEAFAAAVLQIGQPEVLHAEFAKARQSLAAVIKKMIFVLAGVPNPQLATNMNTIYPPINVEPRWATYLKASAFTLPAAFAWFFCMVFVAPKINEMCQHAGTRLFTFPEGHPLLAMFGAVSNGMLYLAPNALYATVAVVVVLGLLEWRSDWWPRYRRAALGIAAFLLNLLALVAITMLVLTACIVAPSLAHAR